MRSKTVTRRALFLLAVAGLSSLSATDSAGSPSIITCASALALAEPVLGPQRTIVILVEFDDILHRKSIDEINGTMRQADAYWRDVSYEKICIKWSFAGWYKLNHSLSHYGTDAGRTGNDTRGSELVRDAILAADEDVNYTDFRHVLIIHAGIDQRISYYDKDPWPHYWWGLRIRTDDGVVDRAMYVAEFSRLGAYVHEFAHSLGLPDLYPKDQTKPSLVGDWSLMDSGEWLGNPKGSSPSRLEAWSTIRLGWLSPLELSPSIDGISVTLSSLEEPTGTRAVKIATHDGLYYLVELRRRIRTDEWLPLEGLVISLINETAQRGHDCYGVVNVTRWLPLYGEDIYADSFRKVFVRLVKYAGSSCEIVIGSRAIRLEYDLATKALLFIPTNVALRFVDWSGRSITNLPVTLHIDEDLRNVTTDERGEIRTTLLFTSPGIRTIRIEVRGVVVDDALLSRQVEVTWTPLLPPMFLLCVVGAVLSKAIKGRLRRPRIAAHVTKDGPNIQHIGGKRCAFYHISIRNERKRLGLTIDPVRDAEAMIIFQDRNGNEMFRLPAKWESRPKPMRYVEQTGKLVELPDVELIHRAGILDVGSGSVETLCLCMKYEGEQEVYAFDAFSYLYSEYKNPSWKVGEGDYLVTVLLNADNIYAEFTFTLKNQGTKVKDVKLNRVA